MPCFSNGKSSRDHDPRTHAFQVIEQHSIPIFTEDWGADEELLLLEGAETYGLGSWADIADHIGGYRGKDEVRDHYIQTYLESSKYPLPELASPEETKLSDKVSRDEFQAQKKRRIAERKEAARTAPPAAPKQKPTASVPACHEVQGYMPGRLEFETEYFNEAEEAVQHMLFETGDLANEPEMDLKMTIMDIYNARLTARVERKRVIFEHKLLEYRKNSAIDKKRSKEERELVNRTKPLARMMRQADYEDFVRGLEYEHNLRQAISQLQDWRQMQISDLRAGERYEHEKQVRVTRPVGGSGGLGGGGTYDRLASSMSALSSTRLGGSHKMASSAQADSHHHHHHHHGGQNHHHHHQTATCALTAPDLPIREPDGNGLGLGLGLHTPPPSDRDAADPNSKDYTNGASSYPTKTKHIVPPLPNGLPPLELSPGVPDSSNVNGNGILTANGITSSLSPSSSSIGTTSAADLQLLSPEERHVCSVLHIKPKPYMAIKEAILREALKQGGVLKRKAVKEICKLDGQKGIRLFDFFVSCGWIGRA